MHMVMDGYRDGYRGLGLLVWLNRDLIFAFGTVMAGLVAGAFLGSVLIHP